MGPKMQVVAASFGFSNFTMNLIAKDVPDVDARRRARGGEGASLSWVVGHLINYRYRTMNLLGSDAKSPYAETIGDSATDGSGYPALEKLLATWNQTSQKLDAVMSDKTDAYLEANPGGNSPHGEKSRLETLTFYAWHESYHIGQMGTLRRDMGYPATSDLAVAAAQADRS